MTENRPTPDGRVYWGRRPDELAASCVEHAARDGYRLDLEPNTPVIPNEPWFEGDRGTWGEIETMLRRWGDIGCSWVNLRFGLDANGNAIVRYEARPSGTPLDEGGMPTCNGGFDPPTETRV